jgi:tetratricopeptide (TPR) repeat protein
MTFERLMPLAAVPFTCIALLSACASTGTPAASHAAAAVVKPVPTMATAMADADAAMLAGQNDKAYAILRKAGGNFPTDKAPWVRMAQMHFDSTNYGEAIVDALEALERDPDDTLANSIVAVSGLRVTSKALADLSKKNNLTGNVRTEAQDLAKLLRTSLNEEVLVPTTRPVAAHARETVRRAASAARSTASSDPFGALK